ncbi:MAG: hypothetical protein ACODTU_20400 [Pigmentiphaga sp.]|uniref:hypothetical protein n=1 Tax=Pigmentiphaga sp. TaxID=1977564 RepID=UPI003B547B1E
MYKTLMVLLFATFSALATAAQAGVTVRPMPSAALGKQVAADTEHWSKVIKTADIKAD